MANRISVILEATTDKAVGALKGFKQSVADADGAFGKIKAGGASAFDSIKQNAGLAAVGVVGAVGVMASKSSEAASRLGESVNAVNVTFGKSAEGIKALGEEAAESVGLSNAAFNGLAVQFSSFAETIAGKGGDVVGTIDDMTHRAADFASVMNIDVAEAARLFQSGLAGETEPLKKFGIDLSAAAVEAHALEKGMVDSKSEMTEAIKVQARYSLLMEKTEKTAGDFANTSDGLANSQRILAAKMEDTAAKAGKKLAPALAQVTTAMSDIIPVAGTIAVKVGESFEKIVDQAYAFGSAIADMVDALPFVDMPGPIAETLYEQERLARGTADLVAEYAKGGPTMEQFVAKLQGQGLSLHAINLATIEYRKQLDGTHDSLGEVIEVTEEAADAEKSLKEQMEGGTTTAELAEQAGKALADQHEAAAEAAVEQAEALADLTAELMDAANATFDLESATLNLNNSYAAYQESVLALAEQVAAGELTDREAIAAKNDLRLSEIDLAKEAKATAEEFALQSGAAVDSAESATLQKEKLYELAAAMPELRDEVRQYINELNQVPGVITTRFEITATGATVTPHGDFIGLPGGARAAGGPVAAGHSYLVGERGMELFTPAVNGHITPHNAIAGGWPAAGSVPVGDTYSATVNNNGRDFTVADMSRALTLAKLSR